MHRTNGQKAQMIKTIVGCPATLRFGVVQDRLRYLSEKDALRRLQTFPPSPRNGAVRPKPSRLLRLIEVALSVSAGGSSKQEKRWREAGRDRQVEAVSKRRKADQFRCTCRAAVLGQSRLRPRRWPRPVVLGLLGKRCCAPDRSRARRRALRPQVRQGVPVPGRLATPSARGENACESWPRPS